MRQPIPCPSKGFFKIDNLFGELVTEAQRQIARKHLGVSDEYTLFWGNIKGYIEDLKDFIKKLQELIREYGGELTEITNQAVADVNARLDALLNEVDSILAQSINDFKIQSKEEIETFKAEFLESMIAWEVEVTTLIQQWDDLNLLDYPYTNPKDPTIQTVGDALTKLGLGVAKVNTLEELYSFSAEWGDLVYVLETDITYKYTKNGWYAMELALVVSDVEPVNRSVIWYEPASEFNVNLEGNLTSLRSSIKTLEEQMAQVIKLVNYGIIAGNSSIGARTIMYNSDTPVNPNTGEIEPIEPDKTELLYTVPNISVKYDTLENFGKNKRNLIDGELVWITDKNSLYIYLNNSFIPISSGGGSGEIVTPEDDMTQEDIEKLYFNHLGLTNKNNDLYRLELNENGNIIVYNTYNYDGIIGTAFPNGSYISDYLKINSLFIGGENTNLDEFTACSHNYVELANADTKDINLYGIYLLYRKPGGSSWESIELKGTIKAGSTFLIRGARCSYKSNVTLDIDDYDMQWYNTEGKLISFNEGGGCFYLVCSNEGLFNNTTGWVSLNDLGSFDPYISTGSPVGYIDLVGLRLPKSSYTIHAEGGSPVSINPSEDAKKCIFVRSFPLDPCSLALKAHNAKKSSALWTYINMDKVPEEAFPYYSMENKHLYVPKSSKQNKTIYGTRNTFTEDAPNMVNITFGIQATDNGYGATRCFNWVSVGYYDEYIEYKKSTETWDKALTKKSISIDNYTSEYSGDTNVAQFINIYNRIKWLSTNKTVVTTHKVILRGLAYGTYNYRIRRVGDPNYISDEYTFTVRLDSTVNMGFSYIHTTDLQSFNYYEYQAWTKAAYAINKNHPDILFTLNTGDCTLNGNRESEWLDYYEGRRFLRDKEEMYVIGNNDLCGVIPYELGDGTAKIYKINHKNILYYYTFELDSNNPAIFTYVDTAIESNKIGDVLSYDSVSFTYYMPSLYSFNYGNYHFIGINSEFADNTSKIYYNDSSKTELIRSHAYYNMYKWIERDVNLYTNKNYVAFMHELPFCITKGGTNDIAEARETTNGSKLNYDFTSGVSKNTGIDTNIYTGGCNFSELFQNNNIKLALGGHKHTYSLSYPIKENVTYTDNVRTVIPNEPNIDETNGVVYAMSLATGYKLVSNKELPGTGIAWLRKYFPMSNGSASASQYYPMYSLINTQGNTSTLSSYVVFNIFLEKIAFNINNQLSEFLTKNSVPINFASDSSTVYNITINY